MSTRTLIVLLGVVGSAGCGHIRERRAERMEQLASDLVYLTAAVESVILDGTLPANTNDAEIVRFATKHDPRIAAPFATYRVRVDRGLADAVLLVCTADGRIGLIEDATCTPHPDRHLWQADSTLPCEFVAPVASACPPSPR